MRKPKLTAAQKRKVEKSVDAIVSSGEYQTLFRGGLYKFGNKAFLYRWSTHAEDWFHSDIDPELIKDRIRTRVIDRMLLHAPI